MSTILLDDGSDDTSVENEQSLPMQAVHPRIARARRAEAYDYLAHLEFARRAKVRLGGNTGVLDAELAWAYSEINRLNQWCDQRIEPRRKLPKRTLAGGGERQEFHLFLDECENHRLNPSGDQFPVFCLCGVIVAADKYASFDRQWKFWKSNELGSESILVHEPKVRHRSQDFYRKDADEQANLLASVSKILDELDFICIAAAIDKRRFADIYANGVVDDFLPTSAYLMCVDFVFERFTYFLHQAGDARGLTQAESRGPREDAEVHAEFLRLHLEGTQWQPQRQFRHALRPYMEFRRKNKNISGLEVADLVARPLAEKVLDPASNPIRWDVVERKIYDGGQGRKGSYGLKVFPSTVQSIAFGSQSS